MRKINRLAAAALLVFCVLSSGASVSLAAGWSPPLETVLVTASRLPDDLTAEQTLLTRDDIDLLAPNTSSSLLRAIPHLYVFENGGAGGLSFTAVRGGDPNFMLVLIDGIIVNDPTSSRGGGFDFNQIDPSVIESVEVYRGGVSAMYGGEALSGMVHIRTRQGDGVDIAAGVGNEGQRSLSGALQTELGDAMSLLALGATNTLDRSAQQNYRNEQALFKLQHESSSTVSTLLASVSDQRAASFPEDSGGQFSTLNEAETRDSRQLLFAARSAVRLRERLSANVQLTRSEHEEAAASPGIAPGVLSGVPPTLIRSEFTQSMLDANIASEVSERLSLLLGASYRRSEGENDGFVDFGFQLPIDYVLDQRTVSTYAELLASQTRWSLSLGLRNDNPQGFASELSSRLRLGFELSARLNGEFSYSEGFKLPSFFALANPLVGNPQLKPEYSELVSLSLDYLATSALHLGLTYFDNAYRNLVDFDPDSFTNINRNKVDASGVEMDLQWQPTALFGARAGITYLDADAGPGQAPLRRRPNWLAQVQTNLTVGDVEAFAALRYRSEFTDSSQLTGLQTLAGYDSVDLGLHWEPRPEVRLSLNVDNVFDEVMEDAIGFRDTGRLWRLGVRLSL